MNVKRWFESDRRSKWEQVVNTEVFEDMVAVVRELAMKSNNLVHMMPDAPAMEREALTNMWKRGVEDTLTIIGKQLVIDADTINKQAAAANQKANEAWQAKEKTE